VTVDKMQRVVTGCILVYLKSLVLYRYYLTFLVWSNITWVEHVFHTYFKFIHQREGCLPVQFCVHDFHCSDS